ncbi:hypothetical protein GGS20DRAFT_149126 [Poronia punctata]|nr:hypothetical protein GGS20DRAFT_149126 [Poronia punctata]
MKSFFVTMVAVLATTGLTMPVSLGERQLAGLGGLTAPLTGLLSQAGKQVPSAVGKVSGAVDQNKGAVTAPKTNATSITPPPTKAQPAKSDPLSGLPIIGSLLGGLL